VGNHRDVSVFLCEEEEVRREIDKLEEQLALSYQEASAEDGGAPAPGHLVLASEEIARRLASATRFEELAIEDAATEVPSFLTVPCQPAVEFRGRIQEWIADLRRMLERGDTVLFVAGTDGRAERTVELLGEYGLRSAHLERTDELLNVSVLVTVGQLT